jgi:hypothetical protein
MNANASCFISSIIPSPILQSYLWSGVEAGPFFSLDRLNILDALLTVMKKMVQRQRKQHFFTPVGELERKSSDE